MAPETFPAVINKDRDLTWQYRLFMRTMRSALHSHPGLPRVTKMAKKINSRICESFIINLLSIRGNLSWELQEVLNVLNRWKKRICQTASGIFITIFSEHWKIPWLSLAILKNMSVWVTVRSLLESLEKVLVGLSVSSWSRYKVATRMYQDLLVLKVGEEVPAHAVRDDSILQSEYMQGGDLEGSSIELVMFLACTAKASNNNGKAEVELWFQFLLLKGAQHGYKRSSLTEAQDAVKWTLGLHGLSHNRHALIDPQAFITLLQSIENPSLDIRKPPSLCVHSACRVRAWTTPLLWSFWKNRKKVLFYCARNCISTFR